MAFLNEAGLERLWTHITTKLGDKVDKASGKVLSTNDYTDEDKNKLSTLKDLVGDTAVSEQIREAIAALVDSSPETLDTLNELAAALGDDPNFATTIIEQIGTLETKVDEVFGPVIMEGNPVTYDNGAEGFDIKVETTLTPKQAGSGDPSPSNIRPITSYTKLELNHSGKNLLNNIQYYDTASTEIRAQFDSPLLLKADVKYTLSTNYQADGLFFVDAAGNGSLEAEYLPNYQYQTASLEYTPTRDIECMFLAVFNSGVPDGTTIQLEVGAATSYKPYQGNTYTVQIGRTVCCGRMDWLTGKLTGGIPLVEFDGNEVTAATGGGTFTTTAFGAASEAYGEMWCSHYVVARDYNSFMNTDMSVCVWASGQVRIHDSRFSTADEINAFFAAQHAAGTPVQIAYKTASSTEIQFTPIQIAELEGVNTLYSNGSNNRAIFNITGGSTSIFLTELNKKVDIEEGKGLSSNDYSDEEKNKVSEMQQSLSRLSIDLEEISNLIKEEDETDLSQYLRGQDGTVELGYQESQYKLQVNNDGVEVLQGNTSMIHIGQNTVSAPTFEAAHTVKIGNHTIKMSTSGTLMFN